MGFAAGCGKLRSDLIVIQRSKRGMSPVSGNRLPQPRKVSEETAAGGSEKRIRIA